MELNDFLKLMWRDRFILVLFVLVGLLLGLLFAYKMPPLYEAQVEIYVAQDYLASRDYYDYEGFYAQQASRETADTVIGLFQSPALNLNGLEAAKLTDTKGILDGVLDSLVVKKSAPSVFMVSVTMNNPEHVRGFLERLTSEVLSTVDSPEAITILGNGVSVQERTPSTTLVVSVGLLLGLVFGAAWLSGRYYFKGVFS